jgi:mannose-1-phosphate guanylyltransferase
VDNPKVFAVLMAGGGGTRLWPLSTPKRPKQLLPLLGGRSLFSLSIERLMRFLPPENVFVVTGPALLNDLRTDSPQVPAENYLVEPSPRNTAPAIAFALGMLRRRSEQFTMACLPADHFIANREAFERVFSAAVSVAGRGYLVTLGITPNGPNTGYGYIEQGRRLDDADGQPVYTVGRFKEKPDLAEARRLIEQGGHSWNSGMFFWRSDVVEGEFRRQQPEISRGLDAFLAAPSGKPLSQEAQSRWLEMPVLSMDYAVMEGAGKTAVVPAGDLGWTDIGDWDALLALYEAHPELRPSGAGVQVDAGSHGLAVFRDGSPARVLATIGLEDVTIVETDDTILICKRGKSQEVRAVVEALKNRSADGA